MKYKETHPWLTFQANLSNAPVKLWLMLGECHSKCEHLARVPLRPSVAQELHKLYLAKGVQATTAIEGNTLSEEEVRRRIDGERSISSSKQYQGQEVDNILAACNEIKSVLDAGASLKLDVHRVRELNAQVLHDIETEEHVHPGEFRKVSVGVGLYRGAPAEDCAYLTERLCTWLQSPDFEPSEELSSHAMIFGFLRAVLAHLYVAWIHPFGDGNGRTARLIEFQILLDCGVPAPAAQLLSNHYNQTRSQYYRELDRASRTGEVVPFIVYAIQGFLDGLHEQLEHVWVQNYDVIWRNYVHEIFRDKDSTAYQRRRRLVLDLSGHPEKRLPFNRLLDVSPRVARAYANKTERTLSRDLVELQNMGLIEWAKGLYQARTDIVLAFLPSRKRDAEETS